MITSRTRIIGTGIISVLSCSLAALAQQPPGADLRDLLKFDAPLVALTHARIIDGTGAPATTDQTVIVDGKRIRAVGATEKIPEGAKVIDLTGRTVMPGLVGMHEHLFFSGARNPPLPFFLTEIAGSATRLYLASGVTTIRTTGSIEPQTDLNIARDIAAGKVPGPHIHVTGPYLEGPGTQFIQMHELRDAEDARRTVEFWADQGVTSFKAYMHITRDQLKAAIEAAHARNLKVTGHLCTIGFRDAAALGIDNVEHGFVYDSDLFPGRQGDVCPPGDKFDEALVKVDAAGPEATAAIEDLVKHKVALTSTLAVFEMVYRPDVPARTLELLTADARESVLRIKLALAGPRAPMAALLKKAVQKEMELERAFAKAGGLLLAGSDPTGIGAVLPGVANHREVELLVEAGFTPIEAIHIATQNGATFLGEKERGVIAPGMAADLLVVRGDPSTKIGDIENAEMVFKDGAAYDPEKLIAPLRGKVGLQ